MDVANSFLSPLLEIPPGILHFPLIFSPETSLQEVMTQIHQSQGDISSAILIEERNELRGIVTHEDLIKAIGSQLDLGTPLVKVMRSPVLTLNLTECEDLSACFDWFKKYEIKHLPILNEGGKILGILEYDSLADFFLSHPNQLLEKKHKSVWIEQERFVLALESTKDGFWDLNLQTGEAYFSPYYYEMLGYEWGELSSNLTEWKAYIHPDDQEVFAQVLADYEQQKIQSHALEFRFRHKRGEWCWILSRGMVFNDAQGKPLRLVGTHINITQHKQQEENQNLLANIVESSEDAIFSKNLEGIILSWNQGAEKMYGYSAEEVIGFPVSILLSPPNTTEISELLDIIKKDQSIEHFETKRKRKDGEIIDISLSLSPLKDSQGRIVGASSIARDITKRKKMELALQKERDFVSVILKTVAALVIVLDPDGRFIQFNPACEKLTGYQEQEVLGHYLWDFLLLPAEILPIKIGFRELKKGFSPSSLENYWRGKDGSLYLIAWENTVIFDDSGQVEFIMGTGINITHQRKAEEQLKQSEERFRIIFEQAAVGICHCSVDGKFIQVNQRFCQICGYSERELLQLKFGEITHPDDLVADLTLVQKLLVGEINTYSLEKRYLKKDQSIIWVNLTVSVWREPSGKPKQFIGVIQDITAKKRAEEFLRKMNDELEKRVAKRTLELKEINQKLQEEEERFRTVADFTYDWEYWLNPQGKLVYVSPACERITGYSSQEFYQNPYLLKEIIHDSQPPIFLELLDFPQVLPDHSKFRNSESVLQEFEFKIKTKQGKLRWIGYQFQEVWDRQHKFLGIRVSNRDITERKEADLENKVLREKLQFVLSSSPAIIFTLSPFHPYQVTFISDNVYSILGYSPQDFLTNPDFWTEHIHPDDLPLFREKYTHLFAQKNLIFESRFLHKSEHYKWVRTELKLVQNQGDIPVEIVGYLADITDIWELTLQRQQAEEALLKSQARFAGILEIANDAIISINISQHITLFNQGAEMLFGYSAEEVLGKPLDILLPEDVLSEHKNYVQKFSQSASEARRMGSQKEILARRQDGSRFPAEASISKLELGEEIILTVILRDISERKKVEESLRFSRDQLKLANKELARATRLKDEFLANMSHELRTPLNAILGISEGLQEEVFGSINERQRHSISTIEKSGRHLLELINDILDLAKIEAGKLELEFKQVNVQTLCHYSLSFIRQLALQKNISIHEDIGEQINPINIDERRIGQVLINLLSNAVKFTHEGGKVSLIVRVEMIQKDELLNTYIRFDIQDTGIGIAPEHLDKLFQSFVQIDSSLSRQYVGTGLGLSLVRRIVELHQGVVEVESEIGKGSCFTVKLPYLSPLQSSLIKSPPQFPGKMENSFPESDQISPIKTSSPLILIVEDHPENMEVFVNYLSSQNYRLLMARNGLEALTQARKYHPDIILMDIQMPLMDGLEATDHIRKDPSLSQIPIIALTALAMPGDEEKCLNAGANEYLKKPIKLKELVRIIHRFLPQI